LIDPKKTNGMFEEVKKKSKVKAPATYDPLESKAIVVPGELKDLDRIEKAGNEQI